ncbi:unnamed protein product [Haemonchus placei]|uniref:Endo/exonuclease/phosphatase domain-containing protein n=1 Tax=Haemonchus placei TaxID=6290 RepID=A0A0N4WQV6_HAEPC|nr:unnamed protein product [Haemonchus placei]
MKDPLKLMYDVLNYYPMSSILVFDLLLSPKNDESLTELLSGFLVSGTDTVLLGDFNIEVDWLNCVSFNLGSMQFFKFFCDYGLKQVVTQPTLGGRILGLTLTSSPAVLNVRTLPPFAMITVL